MVPLYLYNTRTQKKELFQTLKTKEVSVYACGPTVYDYVHIGNLRTFLAEDLLLRTLRYFGYSCFYVMNLTDVDDKTIKRSYSEEKKLKDLTNFYIEAFWKDIDSLGIQRADAYPRATEFIEPMIQCIQRLIDKGVAYITEDGSVYYSIKHFPSYGELSHIDTKDLQAGASNRILIDEYDKQHIGDFVLWKARSPQDGEVFWNSPWGEGRPGWHIECSAMSHAYLGDSFDIHCGGIDNKFPHHENEIAQSISAYGGSFARWFFHVKHLQWDKAKMSKSLGNIVRLKDLISEGWQGEIIRFALLSAHYRQELQFNEELLGQSKESLARIQRFFMSLDEKVSGTSFPISEAVLQILKQLQEDFCSAMADDLNFSKAMAAIFSAIKQFNKIQYISSEDKDKIIMAFQDLDRVCGFLFPWNQNEVTDWGEDEALLLSQRNMARQNKNFSEADRLRDVLMQKGWEILDTPQGSTVRRVNKKSA